MAVIPRNNAIFVPNKVKFLKSLGSQNINVVNFIAQKLYSLDSLQILSLA